MTITIVPICYDCNEELSNFDKFLDKKYKSPLGYTLCSDCTKKREDKIRKELAQSIADDLDIYDCEQDLTRGGKLKWS